LFLFDCRHIGIFVGCLIFGVVGCASSVCVRLCVCVWELREEEIVKERKKKHTKESFSFLNQNSWTENCLLKA